MKRIILLLHMHLAIVAQGKTSCDIPQVAPMAPTSLTCTFPEDISLLRKDFSVVHENSTGKPVLDCLWIEGKLECFNTTGYEFNLTVSNTLTIIIPIAFSNMTGMYYCKMSDSNASDIKRCELVLKQDNSSSIALAPSDASTSKTGIIALAVGLGVGLFVVVVIIIIVVVLIIRLRRKCSGRTSSPEEEMMLQVAPTKKIDRKDMVTINFQEYLNKKIKEMFPNILDSSYFVPPVYFNKTRYTKQSVGGQDVYIPDLPDPSDVRHDQAMQHVMCCLRHMAERGHEPMFCLTQFQYEDYLKSTPPDYAGHCLPMPAGLTEDGKSNGCFDFLIIHRRYGVIVGVVKVINDGADKSGDDKEGCVGVKRADDGEHDAMKSDTGDNESDRMVTGTVDKGHGPVAAEVSSAVERLMKANQNIQHLMSGQQNLFEVLNVIVFFNMTESELLSSVTSHKDILKTCWTLPLGQLSHDVNTSSLLEFEKLWDWVTTKASNKMDDGQYVSMIARFCGPATSSVLSIPNDCESYQMPKTLGQAVSLTGELSERLTLNQDLVELLENPLVFLAGPPGTGKTRMLVLAGKRWVSQGHVVHIISTSPEGLAVSQYLQHSITDRSQSESNKVVLTSCSLDKKSILDLIDRNSNEKSVFVIADEMIVRSQRAKNVKSFIKKLHQRLPDLHLWAAACTSEDLTSKVPELRQQYLTEALSVPPVIQRQVLQEKCLGGVGQYTLVWNPFPTDGPPVKHFYHQGQGHILEHLPHECKLCGKEIASFLKHTLRISTVDVRDRDDTTQESSTVSTGRQASSLGHRDVLLLFESDVQKETPFLKPFVSEGIQIHVISCDNPAVAVPNDDKDTVLAAQAGSILGLKRKVVVFVEGGADSKDANTKWNRLRSYTSCTSQLVLVH